MSEAGMDGQGDGVAAAAQAGQGQESKRDRVRRLLIDPLGFRFARGTDEGWQRRFLDGLADDLGYMSDVDLGALREFLQYKGQGAARNQWPDRVTVLGFADHIAPRPLDELPAVTSWFGSIEGPRAIAEGTLVETWEHIRRRKAPPYTPAARQQIAEDAARSQRRLGIIAERQAAGLAVSGDDLSWQRWYLNLQARCAAIVDRERAAKGAA